MTLFCTSLSLNLGRANCTKRSYGSLFKHESKSYMDKRFDNFVSFGLRMTLSLKSGRKFPVLEKPSIRTTRINPTLNRVQPFLFNLNSSTATTCQKAPSLPTTLLSNSTEGNIWPIILSEMKQQNLARKLRGSGTGSHEDWISFPRRLCTR